MRRASSISKDSILYISSSTDANFKMNSRYRNYLSEVPGYSRNWANKLLKLCLKKILSVYFAHLSAKSFVKNDILLIKNFENDESKRYMISFWDEISMLKCICLDWEWHCLPCKNFVLSITNFLLKSEMLYYWYILTHLFWH